MKTLDQIISDRRGKVMDKWTSYIQEYEQLFARFRNEPIAGAKEGRTLRSTGELTPDNQNSSDLIWALETQLPSEVHVGRGLVIPVNGWCYSKSDAIRTLEIGAGSKMFRVPNHSWARPDVLRDQCPNPDRDGKSLFSGFRGVLPIEPLSKPERLSLTLRATFRDGTIVEQPLSEMQLLPGPGAKPIQVEWLSEGPRVVICMCTYNPPFELFDVQVKSIQAQRHTNWVCIVSDDHSPIEVFETICERLKEDRRFYVSRNPERLGFYYNFERCLKKIPTEVDFVALSDQDDRWYPNKLEALLGAFDRETQLVYSDGRVVARNGEVRSDTFWATRRNNYTDLATLLVANTVTGAASAFRASLVSELLPFPKSIGNAYHDQWIALAALVKGRIGYIDQPLYDYVQHSANVIGHTAWSGKTNRSRADGRGLFRLVRQLAAAARDRDGLRLLVKDLLNQANRRYELLAQKCFLAQNLLVRFPEGRWRKRAVLKRFARLETSLFAAVQEKLLATIYRRPTLNIEGLLLYATVAMRIQNFAARYLRKQIVFRRLRQAAARPVSPFSRTLTVSADGPVPAPAQADVVRSVTPALQFSTISWIHQNISPLTLDISHRYPRRINLLLATINFKYIYGGYIGMFNLALRLKRTGYEVRIILHEQTDFNLKQWRRLIQKYPGVTTLFDEIEVIYRFDRSLPVEVSPDDNFIAANCWAAHIAHHAVRALGKERFMFMIQEYEPFFLPMNSANALFQQAYEFPHFGLFSTSFLLDFFRQQRVGVFAGENGERYSAAFDNAIHRFSPSRAQLIRDKKRLLFYARPEEHAARNLFELGLMSLVSLLHDPRFDASDWTFHGIGSIGLSEALELAPGVPIEIVPKTSLQGYIGLLPSFDVGLSLMLTPHPSLVPLEMAAAGMWTVTNTFANKTAERLTAISTNLIGVNPTVEAIRDGLLEAIARINDVDARLAGADVRWPTDWTEAFPPETMTKMSAFFEEPMTARD
jgi:glycosyltransferase involved in cell wall biosynthesis